MLTNQTVKLTAKSVTARLAGEETGEILLLTEDNRMVSVRCSRSAFLALAKRIEDSLSLPHQV